MTNQTQQRRLHFKSWVLLVGVACAALGMAPAAQSRRFGGAGATVFADKNFRGESASFRDDTPDLRPYSLSDKISSIEIAPGEVWEVCQDINYGNRCQTFSNSVSDLSSIGWNDRISSLRRVGGGIRGQRPGGGVFPPSNRSQELVFYDRPDFRGSARTITSQGNGSIGRSARSVEVRGGVWDLCDRTGNCVRVDRSVPDLSRLRLNGPVTSARPLRGDDNDRDRSRYPRNDRDWNYGR